MSEKRIAIGLAASATSACENHDCRMTQRNTLLRGAGGVLLILVDDEDWMKYISDREYE